MWDCCTRILLLIKYAYKLDGYDKDWIEAGTQRTATYNNSFICTPILFSRKSSQHGDGNLDNKRRFNNRD